LFAFASYNCGPGNVSRSRKEAAKRGLDPDKWFNNVELVVAEKIGTETTTYVRNIYKYYVALPADARRAGGGGEGATAGRAGENLKAATQLLVGFGILFERPTAALRGTSHEWLVTRRKWTPRHRHKVFDRRVILGLCCAAAAPCVAPGSRG
jgi:hypothetical protein